VHEELFTGVCMMNFLWRYLVEGVSTYKQRYRKIETLPKGRMTALSYIHRAMQSLALGSDFLIININTRTTDSKIDVPLVLIRLISSQTHNYRSCLSGPWRCMSIVQQWQVHLFMSPAHQIVFLTMLLLILHQCPIRATIHRPKKTNSPMNYIVKLH